MPKTSSQIRDIIHIIIRNIISLTNGIIFSVAILLFVFNDTREGLFLGVIAIVNISFSLIQNLRAWSALQKLQFLTAPHVTRINNEGKEESVLTESIQKGDVITIKIGDQVPCDGTLTQAFNFEINKGLITGESNSISCKEGDEILAGSIVTSGSGTITIDTAFSESRIARMTGDTKEYSANASPIQYSVDIISKYSGYTLIAALIFVIVRGLLIHKTGLSIVLQAGTLASMLVPQGIAFTVTVFFAYGASNLYKKNVLLQEINATEKLGRIKNLCMDKTGTITENILSVKEILTPFGVSKDRLLALSSAYIQATGDSSQTTEAIKKCIVKDLIHTPTQKNIASLPFSSWRQYGATQIEEENGIVSIFAGPAHIFLPYIKNEEEKEWLNSILLNQSKTGERILCFMTSNGTSSIENLQENILSIAGIFTYYNILREGIHEAIDFFQQRGVTIRIISGDNIETVQAVALLAGIKNSNKSITSKEMTTWSEDDFNTKTAQYNIFASVLPEQKKQIIEALKKDGFTAMVGDGANDALAIKSADLGVAMWDGAPAVRHLASVVLTNNSFTALPEGVKLADNIIRYTEMYTGMFLNQTILGLLFFITVSIFNYDYPLTPFNITLMNYFTVGLPGILIAYWIIRPKNNMPQIDSRPFLKKVVPFALVSSIFQAIGVALSFLIFIKYLNITETNSLISILFIVITFSFFLFSPKMYQGSIEKLQLTQIIILGFLELCILYIAFHIPILTTFFNISTANLSILNLSIITIITIPFWVIQYLVTKHFIGLMKNQILQ